MNILNFSTGYEHSSRYELKCQQVVHQVHETLNGSKMFTYFCLLTIINVFARGELSEKILGDSSLLQLLDKHYKSVHSPRTHWSTANHKSNKYPYQQSPHYYSTDNVALYSYSSRPSTEKTTSIKSTEQFSKHHNYYTSQEYRKPNFAFTRYTYGNKSIPQTNILRATEESSYSWPNQDSLEGSQSIFHYQRTRPAVHTHSTAKNSLPYYTLSQIPTKEAETVGKLKYKKTIYPRLHKPYAMNKYPITKTVYPLYRRFYQSSPQRYPIASSEMMRQQTVKPNEYYNLYGYYTTSQAIGATSPTLSTYRYPTTERMDDTYVNDTGASEDYFNYNDTVSNSNMGYYEAEHEVEDSSSDSYENHLDENTTRGYYGDRIYMSTQMPIKSWDYLNPKTKYYIVRKTSDDDDIETLFE